MRRVWLYRKVLCAAILGIAVVSLLGCSPQKRYQILSFFFDGVPAPGGAEHHDAMGRLVVTYSHKPYAEGKCNACHTGDMDMSIGRATNIVRLSSDVCMKCHANVQNEYPVMHGPVSAVVCLACHVPHTSNLPHMLRGASPRLCTQCHTGDSLPTRPEHYDKADCLSCHTGHGGPAHNLLRTGGSTTQPSRPTTLPARAKMPSILPAVTSSTGPRGRGGA